MKNFEEEGPISSSSHDELGAGGFVFGRVSASVRQRNRVASPSGLPQPGRHSVNLEMPYAGVSGVPFVRSQNSRMRRPFFPISWRIIIVIVLVILLVTLFFLIWMWISTPDAVETDTATPPRSEVVIDAVVMPLRGARCTVTVYGRICELAGRHGCVQLKHLLGPRPDFVEVVAAAGNKTPACGESRAFVEV